MEVKQFDEKEEATIIDTLTMLEFSYAKTYLQFPLYCVLSVFIYPVIVYWKSGLQATAFYVKTNELERATHLLVEGKDANKEVVQIVRQTSGDAMVLFEYRFIRFNFVGTRFEPVQFDCELPFNQLRRQYARGFDSPEARAE